MLASLSSTIAKVQNRWVFLILACLHQFLLAGFIFGWGTLLPILKSEGVFSGQCKDAENTCDAADSKLNLMFTLATIALSFGTVLVGPIMDHFSVWVARMISIGLFAIGCLLLGQASSNSNLWIVGFTLLGFGGGCIQLTAFPVAGLFNESKSLATSLVAGTFAASPTVSLLFEHLHNSASWTPQQFFMTLLYVCLVCAITSAIWPWHSFDKYKESLENQVSASMNERLIVEVSSKEDDQTSNSSNVPGGLETTLSNGRTLGETCVQLHQFSLLKQATSPEFIVFLSVFCVLNLFSTFYLGGLNAQLDLMDKSKAHDYANYFTLIYTLGFLGTPIAGYMQDKVKLEYSIAFVTAVNLLWQAFALIPKIEVQFVTFLFYAAGRQMIFTMYFSGVPQLFSYQNFGALAAISNCFASGTGYLQSPMFNRSQAIHSFTTANVIGCVLMALCIMAGFLFKLWYKRVASVGAPLN